MIVGCGRCHSLDQSRILIRCNVGFVAMTVTLALMLDPLGFHILLAHAVLYCGVNHGSILDGDVPTTKPSGNQGK